MFVIFSRNALFPSDCPVLYSRIIQYAKNTIEIGAHSKERAYSNSPLVIVSKLYALNTTKNIVKAPAKTIT